MQWKGVKRRKDGKGRKGVQGKGNKGKEGLGVEGETSKNMIQGAQPPLPEI